MRHGKSNWSAAGWSSSHDGDHDRPLAPRGVEASQLMGRMLPAIGWRPDLVLASTAVRARTTAELARDAGFGDVELRLDASLYDAPAGAVLDVVREVGDAADTLLVVGHEPTTSSAVDILAGGGRVRVVTAAVVGLELDVERWRDVLPGRGMLHFLLPPKRVADMLRAASPD